MDASAPVPVLRSFDEAKTREFWLGFLGFAVDWEHRFEPGTPLYMQIRLGACVIHLSEHFGDATPGGHVRVGVADVDALCRALNAKAYRHARPGHQIMPWGNDETTIADPSGNRITFWSPVRPAG